MPKVTIGSIREPQLRGALIWVYGPELWKVDRTVERILELGGFDRRSELERVDASESSGAEVVDHARSLFLGAARKLVWVSQAHALSDLERILEWKGQADATGESADVTLLCVSKDLDARKKTSKALIEHALVIECAEVPEAERRDQIVQVAAWLRKKGPAGLPEVLPEEVIDACLALDPWTLGGVASELEKEFLLQEVLNRPERAAFAPPADRARQFLDHFLARDYAQAWPGARWVANRPEEALPLLGLLSWSVKQLLLPEGPGFRLARYQRAWSRSELLALQKALAEIDFASKQSQASPLGQWSRLVVDYCLKSSSARTEGSSSRAG